MIPIQWLAGTSGLSSVVPPSGWRATNLSPGKSMLFPAKAAPTPKTREAIAIDGGVIDPFFDTNPRDGAESS